jgi:hypothetical protein
MVSSSDEPGRAGFSTWYPPGISAATSPPPISNVRSPGMPRSRSLYPYSRPATPFSS